jgi:hypothetical protein
MSDEAKGKVRIRRGSLLAPTENGAPETKNGDNNLTVRFKEPEDIPS